MTLKCTHHVTVIFVHSAVLLLRINEEMSLCLSVLVSDTHLYGFNTHQATLSTSSLSYWFGQQSVGQTDERDSSLQAARGERLAKTKTQGCSCQRIFGRMCDCAFILLKIKGPGCWQLKPFWTLDYLVTGFRVLLQSAIRNFLLTLHQYNLRQAREQLLAFKRSQYFYHTSWMQKW